MDSALDDLIAAAAPAVTPRTPELCADLQRLVADSEAAAITGTRRIRRRVGVAGLAVAGVVSLGAAASAVGLLPAPSWTVTLSSGQTCVADYHVSRLQDGDGETAIVAGISQSDRDAAYTAAQSFLRDFDISTIDVDAAVLREKAEVRRAYAALDGPPSETAIPAYTEGQWKVMAVGAELWRQLSDRLHQQGLNPDGVSWWYGDDCDYDGGDQ